MYASTIADAILSVWEFPRRTNGYLNPAPFTGDNDVCVTFVCDSVEKYPWERL